MKITSLRAENYQRIQLAAINVTAPILLLAGANEQGKTSIADAVFHCITGEARRVQLKKDYGDLVHDGQKKGSVRITTADQIPNGVDDSDMECGAFTLQIPADKRASNVTPHPLMALMLDATLLPELGSDERRRVILSLNPQRLTAKQMFQKLIDKGANAAKAREVGAVLLAGFDAAHAEAKSKASEARGSWKATTGEAYGSKKAPAWTADKPTYDEETLATMPALIEKLEAEHHDAVIALGELNARRGEHGRYQTRRAELAGVIQGKERTQAKLDVDRESLGEWQAKVDNAHKEIGTGPQPMSCPHCGGLVDLDHGKLKQHQKPGESAAKYRALLPTYEESLAKCQSFVTNDEQVMARITQAEAALKELDTEPPKAPAPSEIEDAQALVTQKKTELERLRGTLKANTDAKARATAADDTTRKALAYHTDVEEWESIAELLSPGGIPGEMMAAALKPLHERTANTASLTGWPQVTLDADMTIRIGGRPYKLASESSQWRAQATLAEAIAHVSGVRTFMVDGLDVLDAHNRLAFLKWLHAIAPELDTAIAIGTFKTAPSCPPTFQVEWVDDGRVGAPEQLQEAA